MKNFIIYFLTGGIVTSLIVMAEQSGYRLISGFAALVPVFTIVSYYFIGDANDGLAVAQHSKFVLFGTVVSWIPYMLTVAYLSSRLGAHKAIFIGLIVFAILCLLYLLIVYHYKLFQ
ncbi:MAG: hypothetical protein ACD_76C00058G0003 [uncultured bacterium]|nr:MAG: hypothetical protein ACD_76C00058G0003 [uncultured bacterium]HBD05664.1 hypothetical protein [Candidatus Uhrbacteria bacterium]